MANQAYLKPFNKEFQVVNLRISDLETYLSSTEKSVNAIMLYWLACLPSEWKVECSILVRVQVPTATHGKSLASSTLTSPL